MGSYYADSVSPSSVSGASVGGLLLLMMRLVRSFQAQCRTSGIDSVDQRAGAMPPPREIHRPDQDLEEGVKVGQEEAAESDDGLFSADTSEWFSTNRCFFV